MVFVIVLNFARAVVTKQIARLSVLAYNVNGLLYIAGKALTFMASTTSPLPQFFAFADRSSDEMLFVGESGQITHANPALLKKLGYTLEEAQAFGLELLLHEYDQPLWHEMCQLHKNNSQPVLFEVRLRRAKGGFFWMSISLTYLPEEELFWAIGRDYNDQAQSLTTLHKRNEELIVTIERMTDALFSLDANWHFVYVNRSAEQLLRRSRHELLGQHIWQLYADAVNTAFYTNYQKAMREQQPVQFTEYYEPLDTWFEVNAYPSRTGLSVFFRSVNETRKLQEENQKQRELVKLKEQFISLVSHEFRTPMAVIQLILEMLDRYGGTMSHEKIRRNVARALAQIQRLNELLSDVVNLNQSQQRLSKQLTLTSMLVAPFCEQLVENLRLLDKEAHNLRLVIPENPLYLYTDERMLEQMLVNLLNNALKYSPPQTTVTLEVAERDEFVVFSVIDEGIGIPLEEQEHIFTTFYRASNVRDIAGTGLGLPLVRHYATLLGGDVNFTSIEGRGTTMMLVLPKETKQPSVS